MCFLCNFWLPDEKTTKPLSFLLAAHKSRSRHSLHESTCQLFDRDGTSSSADWTQVTKSSGDAAFLSISRLAVWNLRVDVVIFPTITLKRSHPLASTMGKLGIEFLGRI